MTGAELMRKRQLERRATAPGPDVEVVERHRADPDADLAGTRLGHRQQLEVEDVGAAVLPEHHRCHRHAGHGSAASVPTRSCAGTTVVAAVTGNGRKYWKAAAASTSTSRYGSGRRTSELCG